MILATRACWMKLFSTDKRFLSRCLLAPVLPILFAGPLAYAQTITPVHHLDFGVIAIRDYSAVARVTILTSGAFDHNSNVYIHENPTRGEYRLEGGQADSFYTVSIIPATLSLMGGGGTFTVDNFVVSPAVLFTDANGDDTFYLSARLQTLGGGMSYPDGVYNTTFTVTVNY